MRGRFVPSYPGALQPFFPAIPAKSANRWAFLPLMPTGSKIRRWLGKIPFAKSLKERLKRYRENRRIAQLGGAKEVFTHHYQQNEWGDEESISGPGSTLEYTANLREKLPELCQRLGVRTLLDAPCGDFNWFGEIAWRSELNYIGGDIVTALVERNTQRHATPQRTFRELDIIRDPLPPADLWMLRDCLIHLSHADIYAVVANFLRSDIKYLLTTSHHASDGNFDIATGSFHPVRLQIAPYNFGEPLEEITDWIEGYLPRSMALWDRETLAKRMANHKQVQAELAKR